MSVTSLKIFISASGFAVAAAVGVGVGVLDERLIDELAETDDGIVAALVAATMGTGVEIGRDRHGGRLAIGVGATSASELEVEEIEFECLTLR